MSKLPDLKWQSPPAWQKERLERWLQQWHLDRVLGGPESPAAEPPTAPAAHECPEIKRRIAPFDLVGEPVGQIRLLGNNLLPGSPRPVYVALFHAWEADMVLLAPYSPFTEPAIPGELLTGRPGAALSVLCLWNTHAIHTRLLRESWFIDQLSQEEQQEAWAVFRQAAAGHPLPGPLAQRTGPPLVHPLDPRHQYQARELAILSPLAATIRKAEEEKNLLATIVAEPPAWRLQFTPLIEAHAPLAMAAASPGRETSRAIICSGSAAEFVKAMESSAPPGPWASRPAPLLVEPQKHPGGAGQTLAQWDISETAEPARTGGVFLVYDSQHQQFIGSGAILPEDGTAHLEHGRWQDFAAVESRWSQLVLLIFGQP